jgi:hypothetical protein
MLQDFLRSFLRRNDMLMTLRFSQRSARTVHLKVNFKIFPDFYFITFHVLKWLTSVCGELHLVEIISSMQAQNWTRPFHFWYWVIRLFLLNLWEHEVWFDELFNILLLSFFLAFPWLGVEFWFHVLHLMVSVTHNVRLSWCLRGRVLPDV